MKKAFCIFIGYLSCLHGTQEQPWIDLVLQPIAHLSTSYQHFNRLDTSHGKRHYPGRGFFLDSGLIFARTAEFQVELEALLSATHHHHFAFDHLKQSAMYAFLDDVVGDPVSLAAGLSLQENWSRAVNDISVIRHAKLETEIHLAIGKEWSHGINWSHRLWGVIALGVGEKGSPWLRGVMQSAHHLTDEFYLSLRIKGERGLGGRSLRLHPFRGYGPIAYRLIDASFIAGYETCSGLLLELELLQRCYSRNAPQALQEIRLAVAYPFSL